MMRVAQITDGLFNRGGVEHCLLKHSRELKLRGIDSVVIAAQGGPMEEELAAAGVEVHVLGLNEVWGKEDPDYPSSLAPVLRQIKPDLIHSHQYASIWAGSIAAHELALPQLASEHSALVEWRSEHHNQVIREHWPNVVLTHGVQIYQELAQAGLSPERLQLVFTGITDSWPQLQLNRNAPLLFLGRAWDPNKGLDLLFRCLRLLPESRLRVAGDASSLERSAPWSEELAPVRDRVEFVGPLAQSQLPQFFASGSLLLAPSHHEGIPSVPLEAAASGLALIGSLACAEALAPLGVHQLLPPDQPQLWAQAIVAELASETLEQRCQLGRERALAQWSVSRAVGLLERVYRELLA